MEALSIQLLEEDSLSLGRRRRAREDVRMEAFSSWGSAADEEEPEWEANPVVRRKVSFADAFGLDLVSIKEYDDVRAAEDEEAAEREIPPQEDFSLLCLFAAPSSEEELVRRLEAQMVELERLELLPGTGTLRGSVRVLNLCFSKSVYARITLDSWKSYFDLLADYVPGSSDRKTDRFTFQYTVAPPLEKEGTRIEFCLRYETSVGTFWANNREMNYVLFCHRKGPAKQQALEDSVGLKMKRSCLRANRRASAQEKESTDTLTLVAGAEPSRRAEVMRAEGPSLFPTEPKPLAAGPKSRRRVSGLAHVKEIFSRSWGQDSSRDTPGTKKPSGKFLLKRQRKQVLTYHQIPLITLDWDNGKQQQWVSSNVDNIWTGRAKVTLSKEESVKSGLSVNDVWRAFLNGKGPSPDNESPVRDAWQAFIGGPRREDDRDAPPESERLRTAARGPPASRVRRVPRNARPTALTAVGQALSHALPSHVSPNAERRRPSGIRGGEKGDAPGSHDRPVAAAPRERGSAGAALVSRDSVDSLSECHKHEEEPIKGGQGEETAHRLTAAAATTRDLTTTAQNASRGGERISPGENPQREDTGGANNATGDIVASRDTIADGIAMKRTRAAEEVRPRRNEAGETQTESPFEPYEICRMIAAREFHPNQIDGVQAKTEDPATHKGQEDIGQDTKDGMTKKQDSLTDPSIIHDDVLNPDKHRRLTHAKKQNSSPTMENTSRGKISNKLWNQRESSARSQKEQSSVDVENSPFTDDVEDSRVETAESGPGIPDAIDCRWDGGQIGEDSFGSVRGQIRRKANIDAVAKADHEPPGDREVPAEESGRSNPSPSTGSGGFMWWSVLCILSRITRMVTCSLLVAGLFVVVVLYEFPGFFVLYVFSLAWWFYKWGGPQGATNMAIVS